MRDSNEEIVGKIDEMKSEKVGKRNGMGSNIETNNNGLKPENGREWY
jgi:hypothetical protein